MAKLGDLGRSFGQLITAIGASAVHKALESLKRQLGQRLSSMDPRVRQRIVARLREALAGPELQLAPELRAKLDGALTEAEVEGRSRAALAALDEVMSHGMSSPNAAAGSASPPWSNFQRVAFLQQLMPDARIEIAGLDVKGPVSFTLSTGPQPSAAEPPPERPTEPEATDAEPLPKP